MQPSALVRRRTHRRLYSTAPNERTAPRRPSLKHLHERNTLIFSSASDSLPAKVASARSSSLRQTHQLRHLRVFTPRVEVKAGPHPRPSAWSGCFWSPGAGVLLGVIKEVGGLESGASSFSASPETVAPTSVRVGVEVGGGTGGWGLFPGALVQLRRRALGPDLSCGGAPGVSSSGR